MFNLGRVGYFAVSRTNNVINYRQRNLHNGMYVCMNVDDTQNKHHFELLTKLY